MTEFLSPIKRLFARAAMVGALVLSGAACGDNEATPASAAATREVVISEDYYFNGSSWGIECFGPLTSTVAKAGDTLLELAYREADVHQPAALGRFDVPNAVVARAVGDLNELDDPDLIYAGRAYLIPDACGPSDN